MKGILACSVLRFCDTIVGYLQAHPLGHYANLSYHPLIGCIGRAMSNSNVSQEVFDTWKADIQKAFKSKNFYSFEIGAVSQENGLLVDPRPLIQTVRSKELHCVRLSILTLISNHR